MCTSTITQFYVDPERISEVVKLLPPSCLKHEGSSHYWEETNIDLNIYDLAPELAALVLRVVHITTAPTLEALRAAQPGLGQPELATGTTG